MSAPVDRAGPRTINGISVDRLCPECRSRVDAMAAAHEKHVDLCEACSALISRTPIYFMDGAVARPGAPVDHPPPLCPSCTARMKQAVAEGKGGIEICADCQARDAARRKAEGPPAPWWWSEPHGHETVLWDAAGDVVLAYGNDSTIVLASEYVREAVRAAPEMERLLRRHLFVFDQHGGVGICPECKHAEDVGFGGGHAKDCALALLIARLDAARKAGG